ncbi:neuronal acetylcholine receptor subunit alpha-6-like [Gigantopelta aegis]|uniref:neuronal acetylcholine receptor subunit alpha-6-like n=1 Tax=Gigantopelta aegis TaxID=1735272 RepID=UPI001B88AD7B|nr:neuronal acetylcholine receptor subunit alpha-6-like [Gigantopelta aegis]
MKTMFHIVLAVFACLCLPIVVLTASSADYEQLYQQYISARNPRIRPVLNDVDTTNITLLYLTINMVDLNEDLLSVIGYMGVTWKDEFLVWDSDAYGGVSSLYPDPDTIWKPSIAVRNSVNKLTPVNQKYQYITVTSLGNVMWFPGDTFWTFCNVDLSKFPFDKHVCHIDIALWRSYSSEVNLLLSPNMKFQFENFHESDDWTLSETSVKVLTSEWQYPYVRMTLKMKRKPDKYIKSIIVPTIALAILNVFVFLIPNEYGERIFFAMNVLLMFGLFTAYSMTILPQNAFGLSTMGNYMVTFMVFSIVYILLSIFSLNLYHKDATAGRVPRGVWNISKRLETVLFCTCCAKRQAWVSGTAKPTTAGSADSEDEPTRERDVVEVSWRRVSHVCDRLFFVVFLVIVLFFVIGFMTNLQSP